MQCRPERAAMKKPCRLHTPIGAHLRRGRNDYQPTRFMLLYDNKHQHPFPIIKAPIYCTRNPSIVVFFRDCA